MSLGLTPGILVDLKHNRPELLANYANYLAGDTAKLANLQDQFARITQELAAEGFPPHFEPTEPSAGIPWGFQMYGYSGLHYLRRIAAHLSASNVLPPPGDDDAVDDPLLRER
jgi:hypothetical protein